jgi:molybdopterin-guanine dinucleotide biosynthesis protein A
VCYDRAVRDRAAYILVGGKSSRFGSDKAFIDINRRPLALHLADVVSEPAGLVTHVGPPARYECLGLPIIPDTHQDVGPLAGILAALEHTSASWNLILACDMPLLSAALVEFLFMQAEMGGYEVLMPVSPAGSDEPLCAVYGKAAAAHIRREIEKGTRKITFALDGLAVRRIPPNEYAHIDPAGKSFTNVNTFAEWEQSQQ